jgi:hypothetical protein
MAKAPDANPLPLTSTMATALAHSEPLVLLMQRMAQSQARFALIANLLPEPLRGTVRAGPLDHESWTLLVDHSASAAKLRQSLPLLQAALSEQGWPVLAMKVKVLSRT